MLLGLISQYADVQIAAIIGVTLVAIFALGMLAPKSKEPKS